MIKIIITYNDNIIESKIKYESTNCLYKKCNYKNDNNFNIIKSFQCKDYIIELWGKNNGTKQFKNNNLVLVNNNIEIYGKCIFIKKNIENDLYESLLLNEFNIFFNVDKYKNIENSNEIDILNNESNKESNQNENLLDYSSSDTELTYDIYSYSSDEE